MNNDEEKPLNEEGVHPHHDDDEEFEQDEDESDNEQLESSRLQKLFSPIYLVILLAFCITASIPLLIIYTVGWMAWHVK